MTTILSRREWVNASQARLRRRCSAYSIPSLLMSWPCITTANWRCRKFFSQWQHSFEWKLCSHWLKSCVMLQWWYRAKTPWVASMELTRFDFWLSLFHIDIYKTHTRSRVIWSWISNFTNINVRGMITYPYPNFSCGLDKPPLKL